MKRLRFCYRTEKPKSHCKENSTTTRSHSYSKSLKFRSSVILTVLLLACTQLVFGQSYSVGDYKSVGSGNWNDVSTWNICNNVTLNNSAWVYSWEPATVVPDSSKGTINISYPIDLKSNENAKIIRITSPGVLIINAGYSIEVSREIVNNKTQGLVIKTNATQSGSVISNKFSGAGTFSLERFMSISNNWHIYSSPLSGQSIQNFIGTNADIPDLVDGSGNVIGVGMRDYDTQHDTWNALMKYDDPDLGNMIPGKGYSIRTFVSSDETGTILSDGKPNPNNKVSISLNTGGNNWNCIGNPFTCAISVASFLNATFNPNIDPTSAIYLWDVTKGTEGEYVVSNKATPNITSVQMGQGFFVKSKKAEDLILGGLIYFTKSMQAPNTSTSFKSAEIEWPSIKIKAKNQTLNSSTDVLLVTNTTKGLDPGYDAGLLTAHPEFSLYTKLIDDNGVNFMLQCLPDQNYDQYVIPLGIDCKVGGDVTFTAETVNLPSGCQALLEDRKAKRFTRLDLKDAKYTATLSADTKGTGRFFLHTSDVISGVQPLENQPYKVTAIGKLIYIYGEVSDNAQFFLYSVNGKQLANFKAESLVQNQFDATGYPAGVYILTVADKGQRKSVKFVIEK